MLSQFFIHNAPAYPLLWAQHDPAQVALSVFMAIVTSVLALQMTGLARRTESPSLRYITRGCGALALGCGIWAMHFIGMLAFEVCSHGRIDPVMSAISLIPGVLASWIAIGLLRKKTITFIALVWGGALVGAGIGIMHYLGMASLEWASVIRYDPWIFGASILVAVLLAILALWARFGLERVVQWRPGYLNMVSGVVMGCAISGMHYIGMAALRFTDNAAIALDTPETDSMSLALILAGVMLFVGLLAAGINAALVYQRTYLQLQSTGRELKQSEEQLRSLMANIPGTTYRRRHNQNWDMLLVSDAVKVLTGWGPQDFIEGRIRFSQLVSPESLPRFWATVTSAIENNQPFHMEYQLTDRQGQQHWVSDSGRPIQSSNGTTDWIDGVITDITYIKERDTEFADIVRAINQSMSVVEFDLAGKVLTANDNFLALSGYRLDEIVGQHHRVFCDPAYVETEDYVHFWNRLKHGKLESGEFLRFGKGGRPLWVLANYTPVHIPVHNTKDASFKIMKFATDVSLKHVIDELRMAKERAEQVATAHSTFLSNMSHEIRTPMNAIIGFTDALMNIPLDDRQSSYLRTVHHAAHSMLHLLNDILDTAKLDKGAVELEITDFSPQEICSQMMASLGFNATRKGLDLQCLTSTAVPCYLRGDTLRIQQILINLLSNAIKFTEHGYVQLRLDYYDGILKIEVEDTGIGIPAQQLEHIFNPFTQADASINRQFGGTGLGTTITRQLTEIMEGHIDVRSTVGKGSVFSVHLPLPVGKAPEKGSLVNREISLPPLRTLVVDDIPANLELLRIHLERGQHHGTQALNGEEALRYFSEGSSMSF